MKERFCILLVDDDPKDIHLLSVLLQESGYVVESAMNGQEALAWINRKLFDLILLDVMLPDIDGYDICKRLKSIPTTRSIPVIFLTAKTDPPSVIKGFQLGAVDYLTKPFQREELLARVKIHLALLEQQQTLDKYADLLEEKNRELAQKNKQLEEANASKDTFFSIIAHDVKSPLTGFLSFAQILRHVQNIGHEHFQELVTHFQQSAERLLALLDNLLTWAQIQRGTIEFMPQRINLQCCAASVLGLFRQNAQQKNIALDNALPQDVWVEADANILETILRNLLSNALKFTPSGGRVELRAVSDNAAVKIMVTDTGVGLSEENAANLFLIGKRIRQTGTAGEKGTGLGLLLCKEFVAKHGGTIGVDSTLHHGTTVWFTLPRSETDEHGCSSVR